MGLLYLFPTSSDEIDYVSFEGKNTQNLRIKTYGLPWIFWVYAAAIITVLAILSFSIYQPMAKFFSMANQWDKILIIAMVFTLMGVLASIIIFLYWQMHIVVDSAAISLEYRPFGFKIFSKKILRDPNLILEVAHFMESPNVARSESDERYKQFQNKGYFELFATNKHHKVLLDRSSRKQDLEDLKSIIQSFYQ